MGKRNFTLNYTEKELQAWQEYLLQCINSRVSDKVSDRVSDRVSDTALAKTKSKNELELSKDLAKQLNNFEKEINTQSYTLRQLCKKTEKEILILNTLNRNLYRELKKCTNVENFFKGYKKLKENQEKIKKLSNYLDNPELALFLSDKMCLELLNDFLHTTSRLSENKSLWFSQVSHHFDEMNETQIALACTLAKIFENN